MAMLTVTCGLVVVFHRSDDFLDRFDEGNHVLSLVPRYRAYAADAVDDLPGTRIRHRQREVNIAQVASPATRHRGRDAVYRAAVGQLASGLGIEVCFVEHGDKAAFGSFLTGD